MTQTPPPFEIEPALAPAAEPTTGAYWGWCSVHGGAGSSTLAAAIPGGVDLGRQLPEEAGLLHELPVVAVCRTTGHGLLAARDFAATANAQGRTVLGLVAVVDVPERKRAKPIADSLYLTRGAYAGRVWEMPWVSAWRLGAAPAPGNNPREVRDLLRTLWSAVGLSLPGAGTPINNQRSDT